MTTDKVRRCIDLMAALLGAQKPLTFNELARKVPAYLVNGEVPIGKAANASSKRKFERDKDDLREMGVPIESVSEPGEQDSRYLLRVKDFYLPYLSFMTDRGEVRPAPVAARGYRTIESLTFSADELRVVQEAAARVTQVGDASLTGEVRSAIRKLAFDLPMGSTDGGADDLLVRSAGSDAKLLPKLGDAMVARKRVTCTYHGMSADDSSQRTLEAYGLFFVSGHWYMVARDIAKDALRNFRVSRMSDVSVNSQSPNTHDYEIPARFSIKAHAKSRRAWDIGDADAIDVVVEFRGETGAAVAARNLGRPDTSADGTRESVRHFRVRRPDSFARWLLSFAGDAVPLAPEVLVREYSALVAATRTVYATMDGGEVHRG